MNYAKSIARTSLKRWLYTMFWNIRLKYFPKYSIVDVNLLDAYTVASGACLYGLV